MKNLYILLAIIIFSCQKKEIEDINEIIESKTEILVYTHEIETPNSITTRNLQETINWAQANLYYSVGDVEYLLLPGGGFESKTHPILFRKKNNT